VYTEYVSAKIWLWNVPVLSTWFTEHVSGLTIVPWPSEEDARKGRVAYEGAVVVTSKFTWVGPGGARWKYVVVSACIPIVSSNCVPSTVRRKTGMVVRVVKEVWMSTYKQVPAPPVPVRAIDRPAYVTPFPAAVTLVDKVHSSRERGGDGMKYHVTGTSYTMGSAMEAALLEFARGTNMRKSLLGMVTDAAAEVPM
jgi:hypothetical protein